jgi:predicted TIM-barrel fold metal-dependent hydrolase
MDFFDCNVCFGPATVPPMKQAETADALLAEMDFSGTAEAVVYHSSQRDDTPAVGNPLALAEIGSRARRSPRAVAGLPVAGKLPRAVAARLHPCWSLLPPQTEEVGTVEELLAGVRQHGVRFLRAFPAQHRYLLNGTTFGALFEEMIARRIPLILAGDWPLIESLLRDFPRLTVVANQLSNHGQDRFFRPLVERYPRFYVDTTRYECDGGIAAFCRRYGPDRMVFGSGFPEVPMGPGIVQVLHADIGDEAKAAIASGTLRRLAEEVQL